MYLHLFKRAARSASVSLKWVHVCQHCISLMSNFHHLWSGNPAMNQSHLIIRCHDASCCTLHLVCPNTVKYCPTHTHTPKKPWMHLYARPVVGAWNTNQRLIPSTNDQLRARPILKRPRGRCHSSKVSFPLCFLLSAEQFEDIDLHLLWSDEMKWQQGQLILFSALEMCRR